MSTRLYMFGFFLILTGVVLLLLSSISQMGVSTGGFVLIGPIPIVFGSGPNGSLLAVLAVVLGIVMLVWLYALSKRFRQDTKVVAEA